MKLRPQCVHFENVVTGVKAVNPHAQRMNKTHTQPVLLWNSYLQCSTEFRRGVIQLLCWLLHKPREHSIIIWLSGWERTRVIWERSEHPQFLAWGVSCITRSPCKASGAACWRALSAVQSGLEAPSVWWITMSLLCHAQKCYFKRLGGFSDPVMDISMVIGMDKLWKIQECADFMFYIFVSHIERQLMPKSVLVGIWAPQNTCWEQY